MEMMEPVTSVGDHCSRQRRLSMHRPQSEIRLMRICKISMVGKSQGGKQNLRPAGKAGRGAGHTVRLQGFVTTMHQF